jgi:D-glycero-alpha-D-manno-heptose 1-phosphate guanylyltransferase
MNGRIVGFLEKKYLDEGFINGGIYCLNKHIFHPELPAAFSFEKEILEKEIVNRKIYGLRSEGYFIDIGIPEDYARAQDDFKGK